MQIRLLKGGWKETSNSPQIEHAFYTKTKPTEFLQLLRATRFSTPFIFSKPFLILFYHKLVIFTMTSKVHCWIEMISLLCGSVWNRWICLLPGFSVFWIVLRTRFQKIMHKCVYKWMGEILYLHRTWKGIGYGAYVDKPKHVHILIGERKLIFVTVTVYWESTQKKMSTWCLQSNLTSGQLLQLGTGISTTVIYAIIKY